MPAGTGTGRKEAHGGKNKTPEPHLILRSRPPCNKGCLSQSCRPDAVNPKTKMAFPLFLPGKEWEAAMLAGEKGSPGFESGAKILNFFG